MIRVATRSDLNVIHELVMEFLTATSYSQHTEDIDPQHIKKLCYAVLQMGKVWLYDVEGISVGLLIAVKEQNITPGITSDKSMSRVVALRAASFDFGKPVS